MSSSLRQLKRFCTNNDNGQGGIDSLLLVEIIVMKSLLLLLAFSPLIGFGQIILDKEAFAKEFTLAFSESVRGLEAFKNSNPVMVSCNRAEFEYEEQNGIWALKMVYNCYSKDEAIRTKDLLGDQVEKLLPAGDFKRSKSYGSEYIDYLKWSFDFDSDTYADQKKRPSIEIGVSKVGEDFRTTITLREPYFKNQYSPSWD